MSYQQHESHEGRTIRVADAAPASEAPQFSATGRRGIPVLISPLQRDGRRAGGATGSDTSAAPFEGFIILQEQEDTEDRRKRWFKEMRGWLMVLATVAASATYQAGLNPPGGFWQDDSSNGNSMPAPADPPAPPHHAGDPVLQIAHHARYLTFYYFNATAFVTSLVIMVLLMSERFYHTEAKVMTLMLTTFVDLASLIGAYIAGTTRFASSCIYIVIITFVAFVSVIYVGEVMGEICVYILRKWRCFRNLAKRNWCPVPADVVHNALPLEERIGHRRTPRSNRRLCCCACCGAARPQTSEGREVELP